MRKSIKFVVFTTVIMTVALISGCATPLPMGALYTNVTLPITSSTGEIKYSKIGKSECKSFLGLIAIGNAGLNDAARSYSLTEIKYVDYHVENILGILGTYTTTIYGE
jgi:hypothetical protein